MLLERIARLEMQVFKEYIFTDIQQVCAIFEQHLKTLNIDFKRDEYFENKQYAHYIIDKVGVFLKKRDDDFRFTAIDEHGVHIHNVNYPQSLRNTLDLYFRSLQKHR